MTALLEVEGLSVSIATASGRLLAVRDVSFQVARGETMCIVGESGCGKSMTAMAIMGLLPQKAQRSVRTLAFNGADIGNLDHRGMAALRGRRIGMIFQEPMTALNPAYTVGDQIAEGIIHHLRIPPPEAARRAIELMGRVGIPSPERRAAQYPHQLSGGLRQRVVIAIALACGPDLIIADEPTTALDVTVQAQILRLLQELQTETGIGLVLITHDLGVVAQVGHRLQVMYAGEVVESGPVADILTQPSHPYTAALLSCVPIPGQSRRGALLGTIPGIVPSLYRAPSGCAFANRCESALPHCSTVLPPVRNAHGISTRCLLVREPA